HDVRRPHIILIAAGQLARLDPVTSPSALTSAIKDFNAYDDAEIRTVSWEQRVEIGPLVEKFPLAIDGIDFGFAPAFRAATAASIEEAIFAANALGSETLRSRALVEVASTILKNLPDPVQNKERVVRVGEDGIRRSAAKSTMPEYPRDAVKDGKQGVAVAELQYDGKGDVTEANIIEAPATIVGQSVIDAIKQWKFRPSTLNGEPISVRGKLTFYFVLDKDGKGRVENPKQFQ
ncbi:MAG TPA: energy transducer TonB, partial [Pyrinomonadaceae bacterium]|nr:energy transducer TonB [Pyrinomonadaceae bacterium]